MTYAVDLGRQLPFALRQTFPTTRPRAARAALTPFKVTERSRSTRSGRMETWEAESRDGDWRYERVDDERTSWRIVYTPTGQSVSGFDSLKAALGTTAERAHQLLNDMRLQALDMALSVRSDAIRTGGEKLIAIHQRMLGDTAAEYRCLCGGVLAHIGNGKRIGHVDACDECLDNIDTSRCDNAAAHRFCGDPQPLECAHSADRWCRRYAAPNRGQGCPLDNADDCCGMCCRDE